MRQGAGERDASSRKAEIGTVLRYRVNGSHNRIMEEFNEQFVPISIGYIAVNV